MKALILFVGLAASSGCVTVSLTEGWRTVGPIEDPRCPVECVQVLATVKADL